MKTVRKLLALALAIVLMLALSAVAFAEDTATLTIDRDDSYDAAATGDRVYTWYEVFHATYGSGHEAGRENDPYDASTGELTELQTGADDLETGVAYYLDATNDAAVIAKFNSETLGNVWFKLTASADGTRYYVTWKNARYTAETVQAAADWIVSNSAYVASGTFAVSDNGTQWTATGLEKGYYVIKGSEGANLIAVTTDMTIAEKNSYPTIDKQEKDEDQENYNATAKINDGKQTASNVAVGDVIEYKVTVHVPYDTNKPIIVTDTMTAGLTYDSTTGLSFSPTLTSGTDYTAITASYKIDVDGDGTAETEMYDANADWQLAILPTNTTKGQDIVITFQATVNAAALTADDTTQKNTVVLKYNNDHYVMTDYVEYDVWASGIVKYDGATATVENGVLTAVDAEEGISYLEGVTFKLQVSDDDGETWEDVDVIKDGDYYRPLDPTAATAEEAETITTDKNGQVIFRGLDNDKQYQLIELSTLDGYNMLDEAVRLTLTLEDKAATAASIDEGEDENTTDEGEDENTTYLAATSITKVPNNQGTVLPSTGGIGTTIFYVIGGLLVLGALVLLVAKKRTGSEG